MGNIQTIAKGYLKQNPTWLQNVGNGMKGTKTEDQNTNQDPRSENWARQTLQQGDDFNDTLEKRATRRSQWGWHILISTKDQKFWGFRAWFVNQDCLTEK